MCLQERGVDGKPGDLAQRDPMSLNRVLRGVGRIVLVNMLTQPAIKLHILDIKIAHWGHHAPEM